MHCMNEELSRYRGRKSKMECFCVGVGVMGYRNIQHIVGLELGL